MSENKRVVQKYMDGFNAGDHEMILSCLTEDVVWDMPGQYHHVGKAEFKKEINNENFTGLPVIQVLRMVEENEVVIAEGKVLATMKTGQKLDLVFCDVFEMREGLISKLISYIMTV